MKLILKIGLAALLVAFLAVPSLAQKQHGGGTTHPAASYQEPQTQPSAAERSGTQTRKPIPPPGLKGEAADQDVTVNKSKTATKAAEAMEGYIKQ
jgi:hypothetical protein